MHQWKAKPLDLEVFQVRRAWRTAGNLMTPGQNRPCEEALSPDQLAEIRQDVSDQVPGSDAGSPDAASTTSIARRADVLPSVVSSVVRVWQSRQALQRTVP